MSGSEKAVSSRERGDMESLLHTAYCLLMHQSGSQAPRAYLQFLGLTVDAHLDRLEVRVPSPFCLVVCMTHIIAHNRSLTAYFTHLRHSLMFLLFQYSPVFMYVN